MFYLLSKLLDVLLSPYSWGLLLLAAAVPWRPRRAARFARRKRALGIAGLVVLVVASSQPTANALVRGLEGAGRTTMREDVVYDAVVLLGGVVDEEAMGRSGQPSYNDNVERLIVTHRLLRDGKAKMAILSGAPLDDRHPADGEAFVLARQLEDWGIPAARIIIEPKARNTRENATYVKAIASERGYGKVLIVTSAFHMLRAEECFAAVGMPVDTLAVDFRGHDHGGRLGEWLPRAHALSVTSNMIRETLGRLVYRVQGYARPAP
ncbi:MAG: putative rane protein [Labilithrix sp.]|nr:putative rane protein [Labilithrix sp.]